MTTVPIWLLDVDGVLNGMGRCGWHAAPNRAYALARDREWRMKWAPQLIDRIRAIHDAGTAEIHWATSWIDEGVHQIETIMRLPSFPLAYSPSPNYPHRDHREAKAQAAMGVLRAGRRLIWTDDDAIPTWGVVRAELDAAAALLIVPDDRTGLRPEHLDQIEEFAAAGVKL